MFSGMVNSSDVWDARHDIYWFATTEAVTVHGAPVLTSKLEVRDQVIHDISGDFHPARLPQIHSSTRPNRPDLRVHNASLPKPIHITPE